MGLFVKKNHYNELLLQKIKNIEYDFEMAKARNALDALYNEIRKNESIKKEIYQKILTHLSKLNNEDLLGIDALHADIIVEAKQILKNGTYEEKSITALKEDERRIEVNKFGRNKDKIYKEINELDKNIIREKNKSNPSEQKLSNYKLDLDRYKKELYVANEGLISYLKLDELLVNAKTATEVNTNIRDIYPEMNDVVVEDITQTYIQHSEMKNKLDVKIKQTNPPEITNEQESESEVKEKTKFNM
jgi:hypothetical protein